MDSGRVAKSFREGVVRGSSLKVGEVGLDVKAKVTNVFRRLILGDI